MESKREFRTSESHSVSPQMLRQETSKGGFGGCRGGGKGVVGGRVERRRGKRVVLTECWLVGKTGLVHITGYWH